MIILNNKNNKIMEEIKAYKLSNGQIIENLEEATRIEKEIIFKDTIWKFSQREGIYETKEAIYNAIVNNVEELIQIFKIFQK
jgi:5-bromo-4-chloroindolyl phosphate hydrolysis protein